MNLIIFILKDLDKLEQILESWVAAGAVGITVLPGIGISDTEEKRALREDFPIIPNLEDFEGDSHNSTRTIISIVPSQEFANSIYTCTTKITGDLKISNTGIFLVLPVSHAFGVKFE
jgi:hypothetical protein